MRVFVYVILVMIMTVFLHSENVAVLGDIMKPQTIAVDDDNLYVSEATTIYIYSLKNFKLKGKFGKAGEGPGEFSRFVFVIPTKDKLIINSRSKLSYFTKSGKYKREIKSPAGFGGNRYLPIGKNFIAQGFKREEKKIYLTYNLHNEKLVKIKEFYKIEFTPNREKINPLTVKFNRLNMKTSDKRIYVGNDNTGEIMIMNKNGQKTGKIKIDSKPLKVTEAQKKGMLEEYKLNPTTKAVYERVKDRIEFPDVFPFFYDYFPVNSQVYILTYLRAENKAEFLVFSNEGKLIKKLMLPFYQSNMHLTYPHILYKDKLYQIVEDDEEEEWQLHISDLK